MLSNQQKVIKLIQAVGETLRENKETPSGILYANLMNYGCNIEQYNSIVNIFKTSGRVKEVNNVLIWQD